ncbi:hypothetical protein B0T18DRAFT_4478 [Schizothecium vesticola]|uniref:Uncharacterized protein n=1 Tax=Schizothecium vesticola TaxID=314040 RepID=A0AA40KBL8_9PEZI|nr:hypothetical protein B0T18DRAFT_4478 [Schizothecium vesticola]
MPSLPLFVLNRRCLGRKFERKQPRRACHIRTTPHSHQPRLHPLLGRPRPLLRRKRLVGAHVDRAGNRPRPPDRRGSRAIRDNLDTLRTSFPDLPPGQLLRAAVRDNAAHRGVCAYLAGDCRVPEGARTREDPLARWQFSRGHNDKRKNRLSDVVGDESAGVGVPVQGHESERQGLRHRWDTKRAWATMPMQPRDDVSVCEVYMRTCNLMYDQTV